MLMSTGLREKQGPGSEKGHVPQGGGGRRYDSLPLQTGEIMALTDASQGNTITTTHVVTHGYSFLCECYNHITMFNGNADLPYDVTCAQCGKHWRLQRPDGLVDFEEMECIEI